MRNSNFFYLAFVAITGLIAGTLLMGLLSIPLSIIYDKYFASTAEDGIGWALATVCLFIPAGGIAGSILLTLLARSQLAKWPEQRASVLKWSWLGIGLMTLLMILIVAGFLVASAYAPGPLIYHPMQP